VAVYDLIKLFHKYSRGVTLPVVPNSASYQALYQGGMRLVTSDPCANRNNYDWGTASFIGVFEKLDY
jgi:hypothetical protein